MLLEKYPRLCGYFSNWGCSAPDALQKASISWRKQPGPTTATRKFFFKNWNKSFFSENESSTNDPM